MSGRTIVVGAGGGVGGAVVDQLLARGERVVATVRDAQAREALLAEKAGLEDVIAMDIGKADTIAAALDKVLSDGVPIDAVVICAAVSPYGPIETTELDVLRRAFEINVVAGAAVYQACLPALRLSRGRMIFTSSIAGRVAFPFIGFYSATKFALEGLVDGMRREAARWGVEVLIVAPGGLRTKMVSDQLVRIEGEIGKLPANVSELYGDLYASFRDSLAGATRDAGDPADVAAAIITAIDAEKPETRYPVGEGVSDIYSMPRRMTDREVDAVARLERAKQAE